MDKNTYETYEYLPVNNSEQGNFFIVQEDASFLVNRQMQYVTQTQGSKPVLDNVVYDIAPQQFLVDVENPPELISVSDQFILPEGENNLYTSGYLIQPETIATTEQMEQDVNEYKNDDEILNIGVVTESNKTINNCTEITLNDEQYQMLEHKGWILLEINDKIYLLDTLGLHDITTNDKLIQKLRAESQNNLKQDVKIGITKAESEIHSIENATTDLAKDTSNLVATIEVLPHSDNINYTFEVPPQKEENEDSVAYNEQNIEKTNTNLNYGERKQEEVMLNAEEIVNNVNGTRVLVIDNDDIRREGSTLKVKTKLSLKNFPDKVVLGRTVNGKRLVARVVKPNIGNENVQLNEQKPNNTGNSEVQKDNDRKWEIENNIPAVHLGNLLSEGEFLTLIRHLLKTKQNMNKCSAEDVVAADNVITQLLQLPAFQTAVMDSHLVVTKTVQNEDDSGQTFNKGLKAVVTGKVTLIDGAWHFVHLPYMLQNMMNGTEHYKNGNPMDTRKNVFDVLHVQISESKQAQTNIVKASVTVNKRAIPMNMSSIQKLQTNTVYACSGCASLFNTEERLKEHQMSDCLEPKLMMIDTKPNSIHNDYIVINGQSKTYVCKTCNAKFNRLSTVKNHIKTHVPELQDTGDKTQTNSNQSNGVYKCSMCPCSYFHPSTLSKHILSTHIKIKS